ncbi:DDE superfamily endonuclease, CENP-B-like [Kipferlia bialata]|uniref:DDE superfamily endonuclease, CENP-B-like n=1 Tax=Kipferlia bialata TaxID=797122 RepID=A0A391NQP8_9EUKA|nr:DDE superfamily endonuclease, CENP-B-like [Kipferlia bialata]|eukprot:g12030.t1
MRLGAQDIERFYRHLPGRANMSPKKVCAVIALARPVSINALSVWSAKLDPVTAKPVSRQVIKAAFLALAAGKDPDNKSERKRHLNDEDEKTLVRWIDNQKMLKSMTPTRGEVIAQAKMLHKKRWTAIQDLLLSRFPLTELKPYSAPDMVGWYLMFVGRHRLMTGRAITLEDKRQICGTSATVMHFFKEVLLPAIADVPPWAMNNCDESMVAATEKNVKVVYSPTTKHYANLRKETASTFHCTCLVSINAAGTPMVPLFILPLKKVPPELEAFVRQDECTLAGHESGWISQKIFRDWCKLFVEHCDEQRALHNAPDQRCVLLSDGHNSREDVEALKILKEGNVDLVVFPAHTTHLLQPLDVCVMSPFKARLKRHFQQHRESPGLIDYYVPKEHRDTQAARDRFVLIDSAIQALRCVASGPTARQAFICTGMWPRCPKAALDNDRVVQSDRVYETEVTPSADYPRISCCIATSQTLIDALTKARDARIKKQKEQEAAAEAKKRKEDVLPVRFLLQDVMDTLLPFTFKRGDLARAMKAEQKKLDQKEAKEKAKEAADASKAAAVSAVVEI